MNKAIFCAITILLVGIFFLLAPHSLVSAQSNPPFGGIGTCPGNPGCPTSGPSLTVTGGASPTGGVTEPTGGVMNPNPNPNDPCLTGDASLATNERSKHWHHKGGISGFMEALIRFFLELINKLLKLFGGTPIEIPNNGNTIPPINPESPNAPNEPNLTQPIEQPQPQQPCDPPAQPTGGENPSTPSQPPPSQPSGPVSCSGQAVTPSTMQSVVNSAPEGTTFCFSPGTYANASITPKTGQTFDGQNQGAILDGQNSTQYAFRSDSAAKVTIRGFVIQNYNTPSQEGAIQAHQTTGWTIANNHITKNAAAGIATENAVKVLNNKIDYNKQQGYSAHGVDILYEGNEIAYNNADLSVDATWEAGGGKAWETTNATFRNNHVHHNGGNGLWDDTNNIHITYEGNNVHDNWGAGIYHEIGYDAKIINNTVTNNGTSTSQGGGQNLGWLWNGGIQLRLSGAVNASSPIIVSGNKVINNYNGITLLESPASGCTNSGLNEGAHGPCHIQNIVIENNEITMNQGATGAVQDGAGNAVFTSRNVKFINNKYKVSSTSHPNDGHMSNWFAWMNGEIDWAQWQSYGNDTGGSFGQ